MESIIKLLPDSIANQIAAGEVVQRPASVVKELLENAIDAGATHIELVLKDAGTTLIQLSDNGSGMSPQDARMCFERHATSKIRKADDLFQIRTMGFRGEAMASIAAVAQVRMRTRTEEAELGTEIEIAGNQIQKLEPVVCPKGTLIQVKNLFFNVPARRQFLKSQAVETRHVLNEFLRVAIPRTDVHFVFTHNEVTIFDLPKSELKERLYKLLGIDLKGELHGVEEEAGYVKISGLLGSPKAARRNRDEIFFFVNQRFIKSPLLHHAVASAFEELIPKEKHPFYCIFLEIDPIHVDINIHPTKTEVKFDDEQTLYSLLNAVVKKSLGMLHSIPQLDFNENVNDELQRQIYTSRPVFKREDTVVNKPQDLSKPQTQELPKREKWEQLYAPVAETNPFAPPPSLPETEISDLGIGIERSDVGFVNLWGNGLLVAEKAKQLYLIHRKNAEERIIYDRWLQQRQQGNIPVQQLLFPQTFEFSTSDKWALMEAEEELYKLGLEIKDFQGNTVIVYGTPPELPAGKTKDLLEQVIADIKLIGKTNLHERLPEQFARTLAAKAASYKPFQAHEAKLLVEQLFKTTLPERSPSGKRIYKIITQEEAEKMFE